MSAKTKTEAAKVILQNLSPTMPPDAELIAKIKAEHEAVIGAMKSSLDHAKECGHLLDWAKVGRDNAAFESFAKTKCKISPATAHNYVRVFKHWREVEGESCYVAALKALRVQRTTGKKAKPVVEADAVEADVVEPQSAGAFKAILKTRMDALAIPVEYLPKIVQLLAQYGIS